MKTGIYLHSDQLDKEEVRALLQAIRLCERATFPRKQIYIMLEVPELTADEANAILQDIKPPFKETAQITKSIGNVRK